MTNQPTKIRDTIYVYLVDRQWHADYFGDCAKAMMRDCGMCHRVRISSMTNYTDGEEVIEIMNRLWPDAIVYAEGVNWPIGSPAPARRDRPRRAEGKQL